MDVARAVEPKALEVARTRLMAIVDKVAGTSGFAVPEGLAGMRGAPVASRAASGQTPEAFQKFEAMVLQTFLQSILPQDAESVYGKGIAGDMWKSFLAQELGQQMAKAGGIGIADRVLGDYYMAQDQRIPVSGVKGDPEETDRADTQSLLSVAMVHEIQRNIMRNVVDLAGDATGGVTADR
jgi:Rod binding domain-containing protein